MEYLDENSVKNVLYDFYCIMKDVDNIKSYKNNHNNIKDFCNDLEIPQERGTELLKEYEDNVNVLSEIFTDSEIEMITKRLNDYFD